MAPCPPGSAPGSAQKLKQVPKCFKNVQFLLFLGHWFEREPYSVPCPYKYVRGCYLRHVYKMFRCGRRQRNACYVSLPDWRSRQQEKTIVTIHQCVTPEMMFPTVKLPAAWRRGCPGSLFARRSRWHSGDACNDCLATECSVGLDSEQVTSRVPRWRLRDSVVTLSVFDNHDCGFWLTASNSLA